MPSTAPTLTWEMTNLRNPASPNDPQNVLDTIALSVGDSSHWSVKTSAAGYIELESAGGATPNIRVLLAFNMAGTVTIASPHNLVSDQLYIGITPDASGAALTGNPLSDANPYGLLRWSGYLKCSPVITSTAINSVFVLCSDEVISIWLQNGASSTWYGFVAGAFVDPPTDADGDQSPTLPIPNVPGRLYGIATAGTNSLSTGFWSNAIDFLSSGTSNTSAQTQGFNPVTSVFEKWDRMNVSATTTPRMETVSGSRMSFPWFCYQENAPSNLIGVYRQMRISTDSTMRTVVQDSGGADQSYHVAHSSITVGDACSFDNG